MSKVLSMSEHKADSKLWSVRQMLEDALDDEVSETATGALVLYLDDRDGKYKTSFANSGLSMSQSIALLEVMKRHFLEEMGF